MRDGTARLSGAPGGSAPRGAGRAGLAVPGVLALQALLLASIVVVPAALWSRLPARVADHWTLGGTANGSAPRLAAFLLLGVLALAGTGIAWGGWAMTRRQATANVAKVLTIGLLLTAVSAACVLLTALANLGASPGRTPFPGSASVGPAPVICLVAGPLLLAAGAGYLLRRHGAGAVTDDRAPRASVGLRAGERAVWTGRARAAWAVPAGLVLVAAGVTAGLATPAWPAAVICGLCGLAVLGFTSVRVTVSARGVSVGYGPLGLRLTRIPLSSVTAAEAVRHSGFSYGYRGSLSVLGAAAVVLRTGPALRLTLRGGKAFLVTVDDPETGAALLNDLIAAAGRL